MAVALNIYQEANRKGLARMKLRLVFYKKTGALGIIYRTIATHLTRKAMSDRVVTGNRLFGHQLIKQALI
ncbi:MAG TPA: hypothetical protein VET88_04845 [Gammaproteobacteria bacterium]|nr:hypothetical protein [Gammaproteobacteria bacterium]